MGYDFALDCLNKLTDRDFRAIPPCEREVVTQKELNRIATREQAWLYELCRDISPGKEDSAAAGRVYPQYIPEVSVKIGGEALLIRTWDQWRNKSVMLKIPRPSFRHQTQRVNKQEVSPKIERGAQKLLSVARGLYRRLEPPKKGAGGIAEFPKMSPAERIAADKKEREVAESVHYTRFHRSWLVQEQLHRRAQKIDRGSRYGYIPKTYEFGWHPKCFFSMEWIDGQDYISYIREHTDEENLDLFVRLVIFVEKVLHEMGVAHCDLAPRNVLVVTGIPVLLDYGIIKGTTLEEITLADSQLGSISFSSPGQLAVSRERGFVDDIFSLGRILWVTCTRRQPALESILVEYDDGKVIYDQEAVAGLFDEFSIPEKFRGIFKLTQGGGYTDISEFRADLEGLYFQDRGSTVCKDSCGELLLLKDKIEKIAEAIERWVSQ